MADEQLRQAFENIDSESAEDWKKKNELDLLGKKYSCKKCGSVIKVNLDCDYARCTCGSNDLELLSVQYYTESQYKDALEKFKDKELLKLIHEELTKTHLGDDELKMTMFLVCVSGLLKNPKRRMSNSVTGNSGEGKDNVMKTCINHLPRGTAIFVTSATEATLQDDIHDKRVVVFSEVNAGRENGANKFLVEVIKQITEGGTSSLKKDLRTGMITARHEQGEQKSVLYATTEAEMDAEVKTRFIKSTIETDPTRIKNVNDETLDTFSDINKLMSDSVNVDSWIRIGLTDLFNRKDQPEILIPYAEFLKEELNGKPIFDNNCARSQRDVKRLLSLTSAMTYLFQEQRENIFVNGQKIIVSEPQDFINTLILSGQFFDQSYLGLDQRLMKILGILDSNVDIWTARDELQKQLGVSRNTIKNYCGVLSEEGLIRGINGKALNNVGISCYDSNKIYYQRYQKGIKKRLIGCEINDLKTHLETKTNKQIDTLEFTHNSVEKKNKKGVKSQGVNLGQEVSNDLNSQEKSKIDTLELTPLNLTKEELESLGYSTKEIKEIKEEVLPNVSKNDKS